MFKASISDEPGPEPDGDDCADLVSRGKVFNSPSGSSPCSEFNIDPWLILNSGLDFNKFKASISSEFCSNPCIKDFG